MDKMNYKNVFPTFQLSEPEFLKYGEIVSQKLKTLLLSLQSCFSLYLMALFFCANFFSIILTVLFNSTQFDQQLAIHS